MRMIFVYFVKVLPVVALAAFMGCGGGEGTSVTKDVKDTKDVSNTENTVKSCPPETFNDLQNIAGSVKEMLATNKKYKNALFLWQSEKEEILASL